MSFQGEAIERTEVLPKDKSFIGFVGGLFTLLVYSMGLNKSEKTLNLTDFQIEILKDFLFPVISENITMQLEAGAEIVMIFDSSAHFLQQKSFLKYLDMMS